MYLLFPYIHELYIKYYNIRLYTCAIVYYLLFMFYFPHFFFIVGPWIQP